MFLAEVALGKEHGIDRDDWSLTKPPSGYDSIVARGRTEPGMLFILIIAHIYTPLVVIIYNNCTYVLKKFAYDIYINECGTLSMMTALKTLICSI